MEEPICMTDLSDLEKLLAERNITEEEAVRLLSGSHRKPQEIVGVSSGRTKRFKYLYISDLHVGHNGFNERAFDDAVRVARREKVDFIVNPGDHLEGMSHRPGHIYELRHIGFNAQINAAADLYRQFNGIPHYSILGNHDEWFYKPQNMGVSVGDELALRVPGFTNLGFSEADIDVDGIRIRLFHPIDGSAYAVSYKSQKYIELLPSGEKPNILHSGHYHKALYMFSRNVHAFESGTLCNASSFMRGKKLAAHVGFGVVDVKHGGGEVKELRHLFVPYYT